LHFFGRTSCIIGFLFSLIGLLFIIFFSFQINWQIYFAGKKDLVATQGIITGFQETEYAVNDNPLFSYNYRYNDHSDNTYFGNFMEFEGEYSLGQSVDIEYLRKSPDSSRFMGRDRRNFDQIMFLGGIGAFLTGLFFLVPSSRKTRRERRLIMTGLPAEGRLILAEPTNLLINEQPVYNLTFEFKSGRNSSEKCSIRSHLIRNFSNEHREKLIYDPRKPSNAIVIDTLPGPVARYILKKLNPSFV
jgi:hypothetical protein